MKHHLPKLILCLVILTVHVLGFAQSKEEASLMPVPQNMILEGTDFRLNNEFYVRIEGPNSDRVNLGANDLLRSIDKKTGLFIKQSPLLNQPEKLKEGNVLVLAYAAVEKLQLGMNEDYELSVSEGAILIEAASDIGILRGLVTLKQLLLSDQQGYYFPGVAIQDAPRFEWRGLLIDVARHFQSVEVIKRNLRGMAAVKMNVLHWHLCDDHGWRVESNVYPLLHQKSAKEGYYTQAQIKDIVLYADQLGIRVIPEFDVPGHATSVLVAYPELGSGMGPYELKDHAGIFSNVLNPFEPQTYAFLQALLEEMTSLFPDDYVHIGGDENNGVAWERNQEIIDKARSLPGYRPYDPVDYGSDFAALKQMRHKNTAVIQTYFNNKLIKILAELDKNMMGWEEILQPGMSKDAVVHSWLGPKSMVSAAKQGYKSLLSSGYYIDLLRPASQHYLNDPLPAELQKDLSDAQKALILGGEATMWSELVTETTIDSRIWPRTAAIAERLWSSSDVTDIRSMYERLDVMSQRLEDVGLNHKTSRDRIIRNLANGCSIEPIETLISVVEPYKDYTRNAGDVRYYLYSPYTMVADAASADAPGAREFAWLVDDYLQSKEKKQLAAQLNTLMKDWIHNHEAFLECSAASPVLRTMDATSENLKKLSEFGVLAIGAIEKGEQLPIKDYNAAKALIEHIKKDVQTRRNDRWTEQSPAADQSFEGGRVELVVLNDFAKLLEATQQIP